MSIIDSQSKAIMVRAMRNVLENNLIDGSNYLSESKIVKGIDFVNESATYEQLLNLTMNPYRDSKYLPAHVLEGAAAILYSACLTGRKKIGPKAIVEGAKILKAKTGAVITESMLDAAYNAVKGGGLQVIGESYRISLNEGKLGDMWGKIKSGAGKAWGVTKSGAKRAWGATKSGAGKAWDVTKSGSKKIGKGARWASGYDNFRDGTLKGKLIGTGKVAALAAALGISVYAARKLIKKLRSEED